MHRNHNINASRSRNPDRMNGSKCRKMGALWAIAQGLLTAFLPQLSVKTLKRMIGRNFDNAEDLEATPAYLRQLRAIGIGLAASGIASLAMEQVADEENDGLDA